MLQSEFESRYDPAVFELVQIDYDTSTAEQLHEYWDPFQPEFPILVGCAQLLQQYGNGFIPYNVLIGPDGVLAYSRPGFNEHDLHQAIDLLAQSPGPVSGAALQVSSGIATLSWNPASFASGYLVYSSPLPFGPFDQLAARTPLPAHSFPLDARLRFYQVRSEVIIELPR